MFSSGAAGLSHVGADLLDMLVPVLLFDKTAISVEGHTDNVQVASGTFASNWELSSTRAIAVVEFLIGRGLHGDRCAPSAMPIPCRLPITPRPRAAPGTAG